MKSSNDTSHFSYGKVYLVGAGPGDPDLLTVKAVKLLRKADVILYDDLISSHSMKYIKKKAEIIYVGKRHGKESWKQADINHLLIESAKKHVTVVRLKGGDPAVFARLGEEVEALEDAGIQYEVVPGITSASSAVADLGLPFTHRDYASEVVIVSGNKKEGEINDAFRTLQCKNKTLLVYMGLSHLASICNELKAAGNSPSTPVSILENTSYTKKREIRGSLDTIQSIAKDQNVKSPVMIIIGGILHFQIQLENKNALYENEDLLVFR